MIARLTGMLLVANFLGACTYYAEPSIVDLVEDKVIVEWAVSDLPGNLFATRNSATLEDIQRVADRGCAFHDKKAVSLGHVCGQTGFDSTGSFCAAYHYSFLCR